jgi:hypothetical protein
MFDQHRQNFHCIGPDNELVMIRTHVFGDTASVMQLAEILFFKTYRESLDRIRRFLRH